MAQASLPNLNPIPRELEYEHSKIFIADCFFPKRALPGHISAADYNNRATHEWLTMGYTVPQLWAVFDRLHGDDATKFKTRTHQYRQRHREANMQLDLSKRSASKFLPRFASYVVAGGYTVEQLLFGVKARVMHYNYLGVPVAFTPDFDADNQQNYYDPVDPPPILWLSKPRDVPAKVREALNLPSWEEFLKQSPMTYQHYFPTAYGRWEQAQFDAGIVEFVPPPQLPTLRAPVIAANQAPIVPPTQPKTQNLRTPTEEQWENGIAATIIYGLNSTILLPTSQTHGIVSSVDDTSRPGVHTATDDMGAGLVIADPTSNSVSDVNPAQTASKREHHGSWQEHANDEEAGGRDGVATGEDHGGDYEGDDANQQGYSHVVDTSFPLRMGHRSNSMLEGNRGQALSQATTSSQREQDDVLGKQWSNYMSGEHDEENVTQDALLGESIQWLNPEDDSIDMTEYQAQDGKASPTLNPKPHTQYLPPTPQSLAPTPKP